MQGKSLSYQIVMTMTVMRIHTQNALSSQNGGQRSTEMNKERREPEYLRCFRYSAVDFCLASTPMTPYYSADRRALLSKSSERNCPSLPTFILQSQCAPGVGGEQSVLKDASKKRVS